MATDASPPYRFGSLLARARRSWVEQVRELAIGQLGEAMGISRQAARQMADGLVGRGYATFGTDQADARRTLVVLTPSGKAYGRAIWMAQDALNETVRNRVSEADLAAADAVLRAVFADDKARQRVDERTPPADREAVIVSCGIRQNRSARKQRSPYGGRSSGTMPTARIPNMGSAVGIRTGAKPECGSLAPGS